MAARFNGSGIIGNSPKNPSLVCFAYMRVFHTWEDTHSLFVVFCPFLFPHPSRFATVHHYNRGRSLFRNSIAGKTFYEGKPVSYAVLEFFPLFHRATSLSPLFLRVLLSEIFYGGRIIMIDNFILIVVDQLFTISLVKVIALSRWYRSGASTRDIVHAYVS